MIRLIVHNWLSIKVAKLSNPINMFLNRIRVHSWSERSRSTVYSENSKINFVISLQQTHEVKKEGSLKSLTAGAAPHTWRTRVRLLEYNVKINAVFGHSGGPSGVLPRMSRPIRCKCLLFVSFWSAVVFQNYSRQH